MKAVNKNSGEYIKYPYKVYSCKKCENKTIEMHCKSEIECVICGNKCVKNKVKKIKKKQNKETKKYLKEHGIKKCPKCGIYIQKNGGCDEMYKMQQNILLGIENYK